MQAQNQYLDSLIFPNFQGVYRISVLSFEENVVRKAQTRYFLPKVGIKDYNVMIDGRNFFDQPVKNDLRTYDNIQKILTVPGDDYTNGCLLHYPYF